MDISSLQNEIRANRRNPLTYLLQQDPNKFVRACRIAGNGTENLDGTARAVVLTQMMLYDLISGPEGDDKEKALRRHWYAYFKQFSQMFAFALGKTKKNDQGIDEMVDLQWSGRLSKVYAGFVDSRQVTYKNLWVEDASRMMEVFGTYDVLYPGFQLIVAVEKDSLFGDFKAAAKALGAMAVISGKGKNSKAAAELMIRRLGWAKDSNPLEGYDTMVIHLSDHDFDGEGVIGPTFGEQLRRYLYNVVESRIGVKPEQVEDVTGDAWNASYQVKVSNRGYREWADEKALFWVTCEDCAHEQYIIGGVYGSGLHTDERCSKCGGILSIEETSYEEPHGFEVESLRSADYYRAMVDAILEHIDWDTVLEELRDQCVPSSWDIINDIKGRQLENVPRYQKIREAIRLLEEAQGQLDQNFEGLLNNYVDEAIDNTHDEWWELQDDPEIDDLKEHVVRAARGGYASVWRPFDRSVRSQVVIEALEAQEELTEQLEALDIVDFQDVVEAVRIALED